MLGGVDAANAVWRLAIVDQLRCTSVVDNCEIISTLSY
jgi:hypothetical protein